MTSPETYIKHFTHLTRAPGPVWTETTRNRAPHKPILLLAVLDLVARGVVTSPFIAATEDLVELNELFNLYWRRVVPLGQTSSIAFPFSRLHNEPFWELVPQPGKTITPAVINNTASVSYLRRYALGARLDEGLFHFMQSSEGREALREALLLSCFFPEAQALLREQSVSRISPVSCKRCPGAASSALRTVISGRPRNIWPIVGGNGGCRFEFFYPQPWRN